MRRGLLLLGLAALGLPGLGGSALDPSEATARSTLQHFEGGSQDELKTYLGATPAVVYSRRVGSLSAGEVDKVLAETSFTNMEDNYGGFAGSCVFTVVVDTQLVLANSPNATSGVPISTPSRTSITADMHHSHVVETGTYSQAQASTGPNFVNLVASSQIPEGDSTCGIPTPHTRVDQGLGRLSILSFLPTSLASTSTSFNLRTVRSRSLLTSGFGVPAGGQAEAVVYSARLDSLRKGELLEVLGDAQLSRLNEQDLDVSARLIFAKGPAGLTGTTITPSSATRMSRAKYGVAGMTRRPFSENGTYAVPSSLAGKTRYVNLVLRAADPGGGANQVELTEGSGGLEVVRHQPDSTTGTPPTAPVSPVTPAPEVVQAEQMSVPTGSEAIPDPKATPAANPMSVKMTDAGALSTTITTSREASLLTLYAGADICATTPGYPIGSTFEGAPVAQVSVDGSVVAETQARYDHATTGFRPQPIPVVMPAGAHTIEVALTNPASRTSPACVRRLYLDRVELSDPPPPLTRLSGVSLLAGGSFAEQTTGLPVPGAADGSVQWRVVYSKPLTNLKKGEVIQALAEVELQNPNSYIAAATGRFILADRPDQVVSETGSSIIALNGSNSENVPPGALVAPSRLATYTLRSTFTQTKYLNFVIYAAAAGGSVAATDAITVRPDGGRMSVLRYSPLDR